MNRSLIVPPDPRCTCFCIDRVHPNPSDNPQNTLRRLNPAEYSDATELYVYWLTEEELGTTYVTDPATWVTQKITAHRTVLHKRTYVECAVEERTRASVAMGHALPRWTTCDWLSAAFSALEPSEEEMDLIMRLCLNDRMGRCEVLIRRGCSVFMPRGLFAECYSPDRLVANINEMLSPTQATL